MSEQAQDLPEGDSQPEVIDLTLSDSENDSGDSDDSQSSSSGDDSGSDAGVVEVEIHLGDESRAQLQSAIASVSATRLREVLKGLVETDQAVEIALTRELVTVQRGTKRVVPRWEVCANCAEEYEVNEGREDDECAFHPGESALYVYLECRIFQAKCSMIYLNLDQATWKWTRRPSQTGTRTVTGRWTPTRIGKDGQKISTGRVVKRMGGHQVVCEGCTSRWKERSAGNCNTIEVSQELGFSGINSRMYPDIITPELGPQLDLFSCFLGAANASNLWVH